MVDQIVMVYRWHVVVLSVLAYVGLTDMVLWWEIVVLGVMVLRWNMVF